MSSITGERLWDRSVGANTVVTLDGEDIVRLDTLRDLQSDAGPDAYFQYVETELIDLA